MKSLKCEDAHDLVSCRRVHSCCISFHQHEQATNCVQCIFAISVEYSTMNEAVNHGPELWWWGWIKHRILGVLMGRGAQRCLWGACIRTIITNPYTLPLDHQHPLPPALPPSPLALHRSIPIQ